MAKQVDKMTKEEKEELLKQIEQNLKETLSEKRYLHSVSTMKKAKELAKEYGQDEQIVMLTAIAHDIAKEMSEEEYFEYAKKYEVELDEFDKIATTVLHGKIGADIVNKKYGFNKEMQDAIYYHTTGRANMTMLEKIIYLADKMEDTRDYEGVRELRNVYQNSHNLEETILWDIDYYTIPKMIKKQKIIHPNSIYARNDIISKLK